MLECFGILSHDLSNAPWPGRSPVQEPCLRRIGRSVELLEGSRARQHLPHWKDLRNAFTKWLNGGPKVFSPELLSQQSAARLCMEEHVMP